MSKNLSGQVVEATRSIEAIQNAAMNSADAVNRISDQVGSISEGLSGVQTKVKNNAELARSLEQTASRQV